MTDPSVSRKTNGGLNSRRWIQPRPFLRDDLEVSPSLFDVNVEDDRGQEGAGKVTPDAIYSAGESNAVDH
jgi:hypothetical protein